MAWLRRKQASSALPLLAGDICIARDIQYVSKCGPRKYETDSAGVRAFEVLQTKQQGYAELKDLQTSSSLGNIAQTSSSCCAFVQRTGKEQTQRRSCSILMTSRPRQMERACFVACTWPSSCAGTRRKVPSVFGIQLLQQLQLLVVTSDAAQLAELQEQINVEMQDTVYADGFHGPGTVEVAK